MKSLITTAALLLLAAALGGCREAGKSLAARWLATDPAAAPLKTANPDVPRYTPRDMEQMRRMERVKFETDSLIAK